MALVALSQAVQIQERKESHPISINPLKYQTVPSLTQCAEK